MKRLRKKKQLFTLIELVIVMVVIGILAAIIVPNIADMKSKSIITAVESNVRNLQTSIDTYALRNQGKLPTITAPVPLIPQPINFEEIVPDYSRTNPKTEGFKYWIDYKGEVWASTIDSPQNVKFQTGSVLWESVEDAEYYNVYEVENYTPVTGAAFQEVTYKFVEKIESNEEGQVTFVSEELTGEYYAVSAVDEQGFETPPAGQGYNGYENASKNFDSYASFRPVEFQMDNDWDKAFDKDMSTYKLINGSRVGANLHWNGDLSNRIVTITMSTTVGYLYMRDKDGNNVPFIDANTDAPLNNWYLPSGSSISTRSFIIPEGVTDFYFYTDSTGHSGNHMKVYEIELNDDASGTQPVKKIQAESTYHNITLSWSNPNSNTVKFAVYRDGRFIGYATENTFTDNSLYADRDYHYDIQVINPVGNRSPKAQFDFRTKTDQVMWRGFADATPFDPNLDTFTRINGGNVSEFVTWIGDMSNKIVTVKAASTSGSFYMVNESGTRVPFIDATTDISMNSWSFKTLATRSFIVPEGVTKLEFRSNSTGYSSANATVYGVSYERDNSGRLPIENLKATPNSNNIVLTWDNPNSGSSKFAIYRDGVFVGYANENQYTDKGLYTLTKYHYDVQVINPVGNRSTKVSLESTTISDGIDFRGLPDALAFDEDWNTYSRVNGSNISGFVTWSGDLTGKTITVKASSTSGNFYMIDSTGTRVPFADAVTGVPLNNWSFKSAATRSFVIPEGVTKLEFRSGSTGSSGNHVTIYEVSVQ